MGFHFGCALCSEGSLNHLTVYEGALQSVAQPGGTGERAPISSRVPSADENAPRLLKRGLFLDVPLAQKG